MAEFTFDRTVEVVGTAESVWNLITDVNRLVSWISVIHDAQEIRPLEKYSAVVQDKVGMIKLNADLSIHFTEVQVNGRIIARADGRDRQLGSRITIKGEMHLESRPATTTVRVTGSYGITGNAATLGSSAIKRKGDKVLEEFFTNLEADLSALPKL